MVSVLLECTLDDCTGEVLANAIEILRSKGAQDAHALFGIGKKGRPVFVLRVVCAEKDAQKFAVAIARETGTMGVKEFAFTHIDFEKKVSRKHTFLGVLQSKSTAMSSKYEFVELRRKSKEKGMALRELMGKIGARKEK